MQNFAMIQTLMRALFSDSLTGAWQNSLKQQVGSLISSTNRRDIMGEALSGQTRADAAMLRQASKNVGEAEKMMNLAAAGATSIKGMIAEAKGLATAYQASSDTAERSRLQAQYDAVAGNIESVIKNTAYNGISLLDGNKWASDSRVDTSGAAGSGKIQIYAGKSGFDLALSDARSSLLEPLGGLDLDGAGAVDTLSQLENSAKLMADVYTQRASSLGGQIKTLEHQAGILDEVAASQGGRFGSREDILLSLALRDRGNIVNGRG